ncbi:hypothetical protein [Xanthobacter agilis]|uniref:Uncharacterized protein n=1 Tax=Xanthobacter agilis TaxID=47492 RepID=A0ABU0LFQ3_XANAG|nr:hypothetical protein [Xanthobacter agilis]MDQ0505970.1 hypothetical protein [Xanthobacter agilis]
MSVLSKSLAKAGYRRSPSACVKRAIRIGVRVDYCDDPEPMNKTTTDPFVEAMRKAHPDREGVRRSLYDKSVPARMSGMPKYSVTGSQF